MSLKELEKIVALRGEIAQLTKSTEKHYKAGDIVADYGLDGKSGEMRAYSVTGIAARDEPVLERKKVRLRAKVVELQAQVEAAEKFIDEIPDTNVRVLVREYIINGATWENAAKTVYKKMSAEAARKCVTRYFEAG